MHRLGIQCEANADHGDTRAAAENEGQRPESGGIFSGVEVARSFCFLERNLDMSFGCSLPVTLQKKTKKKTRASQWVRKCVGERVAR